MKVTRRRKMMMMKRMKIPPITLQKMMIQVKGVVHKLDQMKI